MLKPMLPLAGVLIAFAAAAASAADAATANAADAATANAASPMPGAGTEIALHEAAVVPAGIVRLGDIADVKTDDPEDQQRLQALPIGRAPAVGEPVELTRPVLMRWVRAQTGIGAEQIAWSGAATVKIEPATSMVSGDAIAHSAKDALTRNLQENGLSGEIDLVQAPPDLAVPPGVLELKPRDQAGLLPASVGASSHGLLAKRQSIWVDLWVDGRFIRTAPVAFTVSIYAPAYVALRDLAAGAVFDPAEPDPTQLTVRAVEWSGRLAAPLKPEAVEPGPKAKPAKTMPLKLRRSVAAGQPITPADVASVPMVARGSTARLRSVQGPIALETPVEVLEDGAQGQTIRVKLPKASSSVQAQVTGPGLVEIRE